MELLTHLLLNDCDIGPGAEWKDAGPGWKVVFISKGYCYWIGHAEIRDMNPGEVLVLGPAANGVLRASQINVATLRYFYFWPELLSGLLSPVDRFSIEALARLNQVRVIPVDDPVAHEFGKLAADAAKRRQFDYRCRILQLAAMVFGDVLPTVSSFATSGERALLRFEKIVSSIPDAELMNLSAEKLAELCGCSLRHLRRMFRKRFNTSIRARQTELKLEKACQLLAETDEAVSRIATASGYDHLGFFNLMFKKKTGMTPTQWRGLHRRTNVAAAADAKGLRE